MGLLQHLFLGFLIVGFLSVSLAAPAEAEDKTTAVAEKSDTPAKKVEERAVVVADQTWDVWFNNNAMTILTGTLGVLLFAGGIGLASYIVYYTYLTYNAEHYQNTPYQFSQTAYPAQYQYYTPTVARSLDSGSSAGWNVNWGQVLYMISLAQESYEKFDFQSLDCQKKTLCELSQKQGGDFGETGRKISNTFSVMDVLDGLPMPSIIQTYLKEYREAINNGKSSTKDCSAFYPKCAFSVKEVFVKYQKKAAAGKF